MRHHPRARWIGLLQAMLAVALACGPFSPLAEAITVGTPTTVLSDSYTGVAGVTYTFGGYTVANGEMATGVAITFPADTNVSGATLLSPAGALAVSGRTVTVTFTPAILKGGLVVVSIGGITNPTTAGTYSVGDAANPGTITFLTANPNNNQPRAPQYHPSASYVIAQTPLSMTITTSDGGQALDFGTVEPEIASSPKQVSVNVTATIPYRITRSLGTGWDVLGLGVSGLAEGDKPIGTNTYVDDFVLTPPLTTGPGTYSTQVMYTVVPI